MTNACLNLAIQLPVCALGSPEATRFQIVVLLRAHLQAISIVFFTESWTPDSFYSRILSNRKQCLHTLCLLDIKVKEPTLESLARGKRVYEPARYMSIKTAVEQLLEVEEKLQVPLWSYKTPLQLTYCSWFTCDHCGGFHVLLCWMERNVSWSDDIETKMAAAAYRDESEEAPLQHAYWFLNVHESTGGSLYTWHHVCRSSQGGKWGSDNSCWTNEQPCWYRFWPPIAFLGHCGNVACRGGRNLRLVQTSLSFFNSHITTQCYSNSASPQMMWEPLLWVQGVVFHIISAILQFTHGLKNNKSMVTKMFLTLHREAARDSRTLVNTEFFKDHSMQNQSQHSLTSCCLPLLKAMFVQNCNPKFLTIYWDLHPRSSCLRNKTDMRLEGAPASSPALAKLTHNGHHSLAFYTFLVPQNILTKSFKAAELDEVSPECFLKAPTTPQFWTPHRCVLQLLGSSPAKGLVAEDPSSCRLRPGWSL